MLFLDMSEKSANINFCLYLLKFNFYSNVCVLLKYLDKDVVWALSCKYKAPV